MEQTYVPFRTPAPTTTHEDSCLCFEEMALDLWYAISKFPIWGLGQYEWGGLPPKQGKALPDKLFRKW